MDSIAFKEKYLPYQQKMFRVAFRLLEDTFDAEDIVQEAYIKLWKKKEELNHVDNIESYCMVLLRNLCLDFLKSKNRYQTQSAEDTVIANRDALTDEIDNNDELEYVKSIIKQLPEQQQKVFELRHFDDCSNEEIEQITGLTDINVRVLLSRARKKMKELLNIGNRYEV